MREHLALEDNTGKEQPGDVHQPNIHLCFVPGAPGGHELGPKQTLGTSHGVVCLEAGVVVGDLPELVARRDDRQRVAVGVWHRYMLETWIAVGGTA